MKKSRRICVYCRAPGRTAVAKWNSGGWWIVLCEACQAIGGEASSNTLAQERYKEAASGRRGEHLIPMDTGTKGRL